MCRRKYESLKVATDGPSDRSWTREVARISPGVCLSDA